MHPVVILELTCGWKGGASRAQHDIVAWLRYKEDLQQGSGAQELQDFCNLKA